MDQVKSTQESNMSSQEEVKVETKDESKKEDLSDEEKDEMNIKNPGDAEDIKASVPNKQMIEQMKKFIMNMDPKERNKLMAKLAESNQINPENKTFTKVSGNQYEKLKKKYDMKILQKRSQRLNKSALANERKKMTGQMSNLPMSLNNAVAQVPQVMKTDDKPTETTATDKPTEPIGDKPTEPISDKPVETTGDKSEAKPKVEKPKLTASQRRQRKRRNVK
ncbi:MAG: hypothetical protein Edafosvirus7_36 [Edafosvirus sp.]|uniref:Uncharacterized protein n=1 Tax=Edafosvirus sp. TaxID=2487765 RepID=A0A3G4ZV86_9VIRU|nr:MAG: hypothetical protein Edafosvirus7_36 [Edafosvirus sp.]